MTENDHQLVSIWPAWQGHDHIECMSPDNNGIDGGYELVIAMRLSAIGRKEVIRAVPTCNEAVKTCSHERRQPHRSPLLAGKIEAQLAEPEQAMRAATT